MSTPDELATEHAALLKERSELQKLCIDEWPIMDALTARRRQDRLWEIRVRLTAIEHTKSFTQPGA